MAFTFDASVGGTAANSYVDVAEADDYFTAHLEGSFWPSAAESKQAALVQATNRIDMEMFGGERSTTSQSLAWPRKDIYPHDQPVNSAISSTEIPKYLKQATMEMALHYLKMAAGEFSVDENDLETLSGYKLGPMDFKIKDGIKGDRLPSKVQNLLRAIGVNAWKTPTATGLTMRR